MHCKHAPKGLACTLPLQTNIGTLKMQIWCHKKKKKKTQTSIISKFTPHQENTQPPTRFQASCQPCIWPRNNEGRLKPIGLLSQHIIMLSPCYAQIAQLAPPIKVNAESNQSNLSNLTKAWVTHNQPSLHSTLS